MSTEPRIELARIDDVPSLARLRWELYAEQRLGPAEPFEAYRIRFEAFARRALASDEWRTWVARDGDRVVGAMWLRTIARVPVPGLHAGPIGYLTNAYVDPELRNRGLGARMLAVVTDRCRAEGYSLVLVWPSERSIPFYRRAGFERRDEPLVLELGPDAPLER